MNSLNVFSKYIFIFILMMLPIGTLLFQFVSTSSKEIQKIEKQIKDSDDIILWVKNIDQDFITNSESQSMTQLNKKLIDVKNVLTIATLAFEGNSAASLLSQINLNFAPQLYKVLFEVQLNGNSFSAKSIQQLKNDQFDLWQQALAIEARIQFLDSANEKQYKDLSKKSRDAFLFLIKSLEDGKDKKQTAAAYKTFSEFWRLSAESMKTESIALLETKRKYQLQFFSFLGVLLLVSFGITLRIFFDMGSRIKKLILSTKNVDPKNLNIQTAEYGVDEIGDLAQAFETMSIELKYSFKNLIQANEAKSSFIATVSHELRTPINGIVGTAHLFGDTQLNQEQKLFLNTIKKSSDVLLSLVNNILDISKIESGKMTVEKIDFDLKNLLLDLSECFSFVLKEKSLKLVIDDQIDDSILFYGDVQKIKQILLNLIGNAVKFSSAGEIRVKAAIVTQTSGFANVQLSVQDQGIGIPEEKLSLLFKDFVQTDSSMARKYGGTGLGLSISKKFAKIMGGDLNVSSRWGHGSTFILDLPLEKGVKPVAAPVAEKPVVAAANLPSLKILIAEDNEVNQMILQKFLKKWGYAYQVANNGIEVLKQLESDSFDLILMDCQMPEMDGFEATQKIRSHSNHHLRRISIIALTANALGEDRKRCQDVGMNAFVSKPIDPDTLLKTIQSFNPTVKVA